MQMNSAYYIDEEILTAYSTFLRGEERSESTIKKYLYNISVMLKYMDGRNISKELLIQWKRDLSNHYSTASVNSMLTAVNNFLRYLGWTRLAVKLLKIQKSAFVDERRELGQAEYARLIRAAKDKGNERLSLVLQTICATGIRVSELRFITVDAVQTGKTVVDNKGKIRTIFLPDKLRRVLQKYVQEKNITAGAVFVTRSGKPLDRSNIWRDMKALCESAGVAPEKVFPHNLRHLFARTYYSLEKDISRLADILGHSNISTTRIYTAESGYVHANQLNRMPLVLTT